MFSVTLQDTFNNARKKISTQLRISQELFFEFSIHYYENKQKVQENKKLSKNTNEKKQDKIYKHVIKNQPQFISNTHETPSLRRIGMWG